MSKSLGSYGEILAQRYLKSKGYRILEKNFQRKMGEIDIVARDGETVCFIEVKTRRSLEKGQPFEAVHPWKIRRLSQMALLYLTHTYDSLEVPSRFDVISIVQGHGSAVHIDHIQNAFYSVY